MEDSNAELEKFARTTLESLPPIDRGKELDDLAEILTRRLGSTSSQQDCWDEITRVVEKLRALGHDLWSHDYDGESRHLWGWDYMRPEDAGYLQIQFDCDGKALVFWRGEDHVLGTVRDDD